MGEALAAARRGVGRTWPNPPVGAVLVAGGQVVGRGYHARAGEAHAEVVALVDAGDRARGATLYVTLEPCSTRGRTPPCVEALLAAGVARVVYGVQDPWGPNSGTGLEALRAAGMAVDGPVLEAEAAALTSGFRCRVREGRPEVVLKAALTLDGQEAPSDGKSQWITGSASRARAHALRDECDAVLVGAGTALADDPSLTVREPPPADGRQPLRVLLDRRGRVPAGARMLGEGALVLTSLASSPRWREAISAGGAQVRVLEGEAGIASALAALGEHGLTRVLAEGGPTLHGALLGAGLADRVALFYGPLLVGEGGSGLGAGFDTGSLIRAVRVEVEAMQRLGSDWLVEGWLRYPSHEEATCSPA